MEKCQHFLAQKDEGILKWDQCQQEPWDQRYDPHQPPPT